MLVYIFSTILSIANSYAAVCFRSKNKILYVFFGILSALPLFIVSAIRYEVGTDYNVYKRRFLPIFYGYGDDRVESGYKALIKVTSVFTENFQWIFVITALIFIYYIYRAIYTQSNNISYSILLLLLTTTFSRSLNIMRQTIVAAIFIYSIKFIFSRDFKKYALHIFFAFLIHSTAIIYLPIYFINNIKINRKKAMIIIVITMISTNLLRILVENFAEVLGYGFYFNSKFDQGTINKTFMIINFFILYIMYSIKHNNDYKFELFIKIQLICMIITILSSIIPNSERIIHMFFAVNIISMPYCLKFVTNRIRKYFLYNIVTMIYLIVFISQIYINNYGETLPYKTIFRL